MFFIYAAYKYLPFDTPLKSNKIANGPVQKFECVEG